VITFIKVDFPAPFSPIIAWISPRRKSKLTPSKASTPGKLLLIFLSSNMFSGTGSPLFWFFYGADFYGITE
jgi:hypothetical protein